MKKIQLTIGVKALLANIGFMLALLGVGSGCLYYLEIGQAESHYSSNVLEYSLGHISDLQILVVQIDQTAEQRLHCQGEGIEEFASTKETQKKHFLTISKEIALKKYDWRQAKLQTELDSLILQIDQSFVFCDKIDILLNKKTDYTDTTRFAEASTYYNLVVRQLTQNTSKRLAELEFEMRQDNQIAKTSLSTAYAKLNVLVLIGILIVVLGSVLSAYFVSNYVTRHLKYFGEIILSLSKGQVPKTLNAHQSSDEIGMAYNALKRLVDGLKSTADFAQSIGKGDYSTHFELLSEQDALGNALLEMRSNLTKMAQDGLKRRWTSEGVAAFSAIFSQNFTDIRLFSDTVIKQLVDYMGANQGAVFLQDDEENTQHIILSGFYGWNKSQSLTKTVHLGEGLLGQAWAERCSYYFTELPDEYIKIGSGLGDAKPTTLLIVPLLLKSEVLGLFELAFFENVEPYKREFLERVAESFASALSAVRSNQRTQRLLTDSRQLAEQMRAQEEEMRQTIEEMQISQEGSERHSKNTSALLNALNEVVLLIEMDNVGALKQINNNYLNILGYKASELLNQPITTILRRGYEGAKAYIDAWDELSRGNPIEGDFERVRKDGNVVYVRGYFAPVMEGARLEKVIHIAFDVTENKTLKKRLLETDALLHQHQHDIDDLKKIIKVQTEERNKTNHTAMMADLDTLQGLQIQLEAEKQALKAQIGELEQQNTSLQEQINDLLMRLG